MVWKRRSLCICLAGCALLAIPSRVPAQAPVAAPTFAVATIKPGNPAANNSSMNINDGRVTTENVSLESLIQFAYNLSSGSGDQIIAAPNWVRTSKFDIVAKPDEATSTAISKMNSDDRDKALRHMVQDLLADRFNLKLHHETRSLPVLALTIDKSRSKLSKPANATGGSLNSNSSNTQAHIEGRNVSLAALANNLGRQPEIGGRLVVDQTGLTANYDFNLKWTPQQLAENPDDSSSASGPSLFAALTEQLGLKLKSTKTPVDVVVIDHADTPTPN